MVQQMQMERQTLAKPRDRVVVRLVQRERQARTQTKEITVVWPLSQMRTLASLVHNISYPHGSLHPSMVEHNMTG